MTAFTDAELSQFLQQAEEHLDIAEDQLLILEEEFSAVYSNSGGPTANDLRVQKIAAAMIYIEEASEKMELDALSSLFHPAAEVIRKTLRGGELELNLGLVRSLISLLDVGRDMLEAVEQGGGPGPADYAELVEELAALA